ncbi:MAG TPA: GNAT family N-acetyltransferase [Steroidobacter sp.]|uniref:GNAT family N-acetyltransferase n=1 Tax=Steroidobacter sp. TaxID=1978227 RepID=UPI002EDB8DC5
MLQVRVWDEQEWNASRELYDGLLRRSNANALFLSYDWQSLWWQHLIQRQPHEKLHVHAAYDGSELVGVLIVVSGKVRRRRLRFRSVQVAGSRLTEARGALTEYLDIVAVAGREAEVRAACLRSILQHERCSEFVVGWTGAGEAWVSAIENLPRPPWSYVRRIDPLISYQADLSTGFERYLATLSGNARRSLFNQRRKLAEKGELTVTEVPPAELDAALQEMNRLHALRWNAPALSGVNLRVHEDLIRRWADSGSVRMSIIRIDGKPISVLYDLRVGQAQFNVQMGFDPGFDSSISLGLIHLGYAMEQAARDGVQTYDFMAGTGRSTDYKKRIATRTANVITIQYLRNPILATIFRLYDAVQERRSRHDREHS